MSPSAGRVVPQKVNFWGQGNKGRLTSSAVRRRTDEYPPARLLLPGGLEPPSNDRRQALQHGRIPVSPGLEHTGQLDRRGLHFHGPCILTLRDRRRADFSPFM